MTGAMRTLYPEIEPYASGHLDVGDGHVIYWERCGTPLTYRHPEGIEIAIGAFDERDDLAPQVQVNHAFRLPWVEKIFDAPVHGDVDYYDRQEQIISFQHPDHETADWPTKGLQL